MTTDPFTEADIERAAQAAHDAQCMCDKGPTLGDQAAARAVLATIEPIRAQAKAEALREAARELAHLGLASQMLPASIRPRLGETATFVRWLTDRAVEIEEAKSDG